MNALVLELATWIGRIGPGLAEGRLWVRPLPLPPRELAERLIDRVWVVHYGLI